MSATHSSAGAGRAGRGSFVGAQAEYRGLEEARPAARLRNPAGLRRRENFVEVHGRNNEGPGRVNKKEGTRVLKKKIRDENKTMFQIQLDIPLFQPSR